MATELLTGTQLPLDAAYLLDVLGNLKLGERGQTLGYNEALLNYYGRKEEAERAFAVEKERLGLEAATLRFQERNADAMNELQRRSGVVSQEDLNWRQRSGLADRQVGIAQMLSERQGPRDGVKYHSLLNALAPPDPQRSTTLDPFKFLEGLVQEVDVFDKPIASVQSGYSPNFGALDAAASSANSLVPSWLLQQPAGISSMGGGGGGGQYVPQSTVGAQPANPYGNARPAENVQLPAGTETWSGVRNEDVANVPQGGGALMTTGIAGPTWGNRFEGWTVSNPSTGHVYGPDDEIPGGTPIWMQRLFAGGEAKDPPMALVGDGPGKKMNEDTELAMALLNEVGEPVLKVLNPGQTKQVLKKVKRPPRAASGGTYGTGNTTPTMTFNQYSGADLGRQPFMQKLQAGKAGPSFRGFGAEVSNPDVGVSNAPTLLNLQTFRDLFPTEKGAAEEMYTHGLEMDWEDLLEQARRSAPWGRTFAPAGYGF